MELISIETFPFALMSIIREAILILAAKSFEFFSSSCFYLGVFSTFRVRNKVDPHFSSSSFSTARSSSLPPFLWSFCPPPILLQVSRSYAQHDYSLFVQSWDPVSSLRHSGAIHYRTVLENPWSLHSEWRCSRLLVPCLLHSFL